MYVRNKRVLLCLIFTLKTKNKKTKQKIAPHLRTEGINITFFNFKGRGKSPVLLPIASYRVLNRTVDVLKIIIKTENLFFVQA